MHHYHLTHIKIGLLSQSIYIFNYRLGEEIKFTHEVFQYTHLSI